MRKLARVDANQREIVAALRKLGWAVWDTSGHGSGAPDLVVARQGQVLLLEVKAQKGKLTRDQAQWHAQFPVTIVRSADDVLVLQGPSR